MSPTHLAIEPLCTPPYPVRRNSHLPQAAAHHRSSDFISLPLSPVCHGKWNDEEKEDIGLLVKEIEKWNSTKETKVTTTEDEDDHDVFLSSNVDPSKHKYC
ncbi:hypothetical protein BUALT_Bualt04G0018400 [Buddleja alternifolia]|uniref:Uncharacterized protein n=1 Tax=Buddleja alternifolia TaxID=168488 RepID=A0AAV6XS44_9LAMI|nr:hypothetical protein BUALT_Bualt04G0018400 [Buddleja alternifolia]